MTTPLERQQVWLVCFLLHVLLQCKAVFSQNEGQVADQVTLRFTARKFLFAGCLPQQDLDQYWEPGSGKKKTLPGPTPARHPSYWNTDQFEANCVVWRDVMDGKTKGHPDFEASQYFYSDGTSGKGIATQSEIYGHYFWQLGSPWRSIALDENQCKLSKIVNSELIVLPSGIPTISYFEDPNRSKNGECLEPDAGSFGQTSTTGKDTFSSWYRDDPLVNRRAGFSLTFNRVPGDGVPTYLFDSDGSSTSSSRRGFFPLNTIPRCLVVDGREDCSNGGKLWPMSLLEMKGDTSETATLRNSNSTFGFTTEYHGHFQYKAGNESFEFSGDDDLWVFINNKLAVDLGGLHIPYRVSVTLEGDTAKNLGLEIGNIYSLDIFHAERHSYGSNFKITTSLVETCNVQRSGSVTFDLKLDNLDSITASGHLNSLASQPMTSFVGVVESTKRRLILTHPATPNTASFMFPSAPFNVGAGVVVDFEFSVSTPTGSRGDSGFALLLHRRPERLDDINGGAGGNLGFRFLTHSIALAFDFCTSRASSTQDCNLHTLSLHHPDDPLMGNSKADHTKRYSTVLFENFKFGHKHRASVVYYSNPNWLEVYIDDSLYLVAKDFTVEQVIGGRDAFVGFTASSGSSGSLIQIDDFRVQTVGIDPESTILVEETGSSSDEEIVADGISSVVFTLQSRDSCLNIAENGGRPDLVMGALVPSQPVSNKRVLVSHNDTATWTAETLDMAQVIDNNDGTYGLSFSTQQAGPRDLVVGFGNCYLNKNATTVSDIFLQRQHTVSPTLSTIGRNNTPIASVVSDACWTTIRERQVLVLPYVPEQTVSPTRPIDPPEDRSLPAELVLGLGVGGSAIMCCILAVVAYMILVYKWQWKKNSKYIEPGKLAAIEGRLEYAGGEQLSVMNRELFETSLALVSERAKHGLPDPEIEKKVKKLKGEKQEITEHVRQIKMRKQIMDDDEDFNQVERPHVSPIRPKRREFEPEQEQKGSQLEERNALELVHDSQIEEDEWASTPSVSDSESESARLDIPNAEEDEWAASTPSMSDSEVGSASQRSSDDTESGQHMHDASPTGKFHNHIPLKQPKALSSSHPQDSNLNEILVDVQVPGHGTAEKTRPPLVHKQQSEQSTDSQLSLV